MFEVWTRDTLSTSKDFVLHGRYSKLEDARAVARWMNEKHGASYVI